MALHPDRIRDHGYTDIQQIKAAAGESDRARNWFSRDTMRFFSTHTGLVIGVPGGAVFVTSERPPGGDRAYTVRLASGTGKGFAIDTPGGICQFPSRFEVDAAARHAAMLIRTGGDAAAFLSDPRHSAATAGEGQPATAE